MDSDLRIVIADVYEETDQGGGAFVLSKVGSHAFPVVNISGFNLIMDNDHVQPAKKGMTFRTLGNDFIKSGGMSRDVVYMDSRSGFTFSNGEWHRGQQIVSKNQRLIPVFSMNEMQGVLPYVSLTDRFIRGVVEQVTPREAAIRSQLSQEAREELHRKLSNLVEVIVGAYRTNPLSELYPKSLIPSCPKVIGKQTPFPSPG